MSREAVAELDCRIAEMQAKADQAARKQLWLIHDKMAREVEALKIERNWVEMAVEMPTGSRARGNRSATQKNVEDQGRDASDLRHVPTLDALAARVAALESRAELHYDGVWKADRGYTKGSFVTHAGSLWHCNEATESRPGESPSWQLAVKKGKDAR